MTFPVTHFLEDMVDTELEAPWATVEEAEAPTGVSLAACDTEHPWREDDVEPASPSPASSFPQHATGGATNTTNTNHKTAPAAHQDQRPGRPPSFHLLYPTGLSPSADLSSASRHGRPCHRSSIPSSVVSSSISCPLTLNCDEGATRAAAREARSLPTLTTTSASFSSSDRRRTTRVACIELLVSARRTMNYLNEGAEFARSTYNVAWDTVAAVWRVLTSKTAQRTLLTSMLVSLASAFLFGLACLGYLAFYHEYLPDQVTTVPVHLQYGYEQNPYGVVSLAKVNLKDYQDYDISVTLNLPRSPANLERGNFMVALHLLDNKPPILLPTVKPLPIPGPQSVLEGRNILHTSTRPAIVPYTDPLVSLASRLLFLAYHVFVPTSETTKLVVPMVERLEFRPGKMSPTSLVLDVQAGQALQVYSVFVTITAQLHGLRWLMHTYWMTSFVVFTTLFWLCELFFAGVAVLFLGLIFGGGGGSSGGGDSGRKPSKAAEEEGTQPAIKQEGEGKGKMVLEDVPMTFPTSSRQPPLRYDPEPSVSGATPQAELPPAAAGGGEADDEEDEDEEGYETRFHDSGIGTTSYSERDGPGSLRRRTSRGRGRD